MKIEQKFIRFPENLQVKAQVTISRRNIKEIAERIKQSRTWVTKVLNGHEEGKDTIELIKNELANHGQLV